MKIIYLPLISYIRYSFSTLLLAYSLWSILTVHITNTYVLEGLFLCYNSCDIIYSDNILLCFSTYLTTNNHLIPLIYHSGQSGSSSRRNSSISFRRSTESIGQIGCGLFTSTRNSTSTIAIISISKWNIGCTSFCNKGW